MLRLMRLRMPCLLCRDMKDGAGLRNSINQHDDVRLWLSLTPTQACIRMWRCYSVCRNRKDCVACAATGYAGTRDLQLLIANIKWKLCKRYVLRYALACGKCCWFDTLVEFVRKKQQKMEKDWEELLQKSTYQYTNYSPKNTRTNELGQ